MAGYRSSTRHRVYCITIGRRKIISSSIKSIRLRTSLTSVNPKPNDVRRVATHTHFLKFYSHLFLKLICGCTSSILCKTNFGLIWLTPTWNVSCKKCAMKYFHQKPGGNQKLHKRSTGHSISYDNRNMKIVR